MNHDLDAALRDLAAGAAAAHRTRTTTDTGLLLTPTVRRVRRRRRARAAAAATGSLAVITGLVLGGMALAPEPDPQPASPSPTTPTPAPSPSATPTGPSVVLPTGDPALPFGTCGALATATPSTPVTTEFRAWLQADTATVQAGAPIGVAGGVALDPPGTRHVVVPRTGPAVAVLRDGVVVATGQLGGDATPSYRGSGGEDLPDPEIHESADWLVAAVCGPDGQPGVTAGAPLPAGDYTLVPWAEVIDLDGARITDDAGDWLPVADAVAASGAQPETVVGDGIAITVTGEAEQVAPAPGAGGAPTALPAAELPTCGDPLPSHLPGSPLRLDVPAAGAAVQVADLPTLDVRLTYGGDGRLELGSTEVVPYAVRDGVVVGVPVPGDGGWRMLLAQGIAAPVPSKGGGPIACDSSYEPLGPGTYDLVLAVKVTAAGSTASSVAVSDPMTLVVP
jgi:hypothetical protein